MAEVWVDNWRRPSEVLARSVADGEGYFRIGRVPGAPSWRVWATAEGRCHSFCYARNPANHQQVLLHDAATLRGVIVNAAGDPQPDTIVRAEPTGRALLYTENVATTDREGRFELRGVALASTHVSAWIAGEGLVENTLTVTGDADVSLGPVDGATTSIEIAVVGLPDRDGHYRFRRLHYLGDNLRVQTTGPAGSATSDAVRIAAAGTHAKVPNLRLAAPAIIEGVVRDGQQNPAPGVAVWLRQGSAVTEAVTDRLGRYRFVGPPVGNTFLQLLDAAERSRRVVDPFEVVVGETYTIDLEVRDS